MSICNDKHHDKPSTSRQIFVHVRESETPMRDVRSLMLEILLQYQNIDKLGFSLGVLDKASSFSDSISWCAILGKIDHAKESLDKVSKEHLVKSVDFLDSLVNSFNEQVVLQIQQYRDKWMRQVIAWDMVIFGLLTLAISGGLYWSGFTFDGQQVLELIQQRPLSSLLIVLMGVSGLLVIHFIIRRRVILNLQEKIKDTLPLDMNLSHALTRNARMRHSIFRPDPAGWNLRKKKQLIMITDKLVDLREELAAVLVNYPDNKTAQAS